MSIYSTRAGVKEGSLLYLKDKCPFKKMEIPANILARLDAGEKDIDDTTVKLEAPIKLCLFCKQPSKLTRYVNGKTVVLCEEDYHTHNIGQIAQKLREDNHGQSAQTQESQPVPEEGQGEESLISDALRS